MRKKVVMATILIGILFIQKQPIVEVQCSDGLKNSKIVFTSWRDGDSDVYVMYPDGRGVVNLTDNDTNDFFPSWSPDGKK